MTDKRKTVCVDAGHGGFDPGAVQHGVRECDVALTVAKLVGAALDRRGFRVVYTRERDKATGPTKGADLVARAKTSNAAGAAAFVSVHCNQSSTTAAHGFQVLHMNGSRRGEALAKSIFAAVLPDGKSAGSWAGVLPDASAHVGYTVAAQRVIAGRKNGKTQAQKLAEAGIDQPFRTIYVLRKTAAPAALVELGFLSNAAERQRLTNPAEQAAVAERIAEGVANFLRS